MNRMLRGFLIAVLAAFVCRGQVERQEPVGGIPPAPVLRAMTYTARIVTDDGSPLPAAPLMLGSCTINDAFGNGTIIFTPAVYGYGPTVEHQANQDSCPATIMLPGFRSARVTLRDGAVIVMKRLGLNEGSTISLTVLKAPEKARRAYQSGEMAVSKNKWPAAQAAFERAVAIYPDYATAWSELGETLVRQGKPADAQAAWNRALAVDPRYIKPYVQLARLALEQQRWQEGAAIAARAIELNAIEFPAVFYYHATASFNLKHLEAAATSARRAIELDAEHSFPHAEYVLGAVLAARGDPAGALEHMKRYLALAPKASDAARVRQRIAEIEREALR